MYGYIQSELSYFTIVICCSVLLLPYAELISLLSASKQKNTLWIPLIKELIFEIRQRFCSDFPGWHRPIQLPNTPKIYGSGEGFEETYVLHTVYQK